MKTKCLALGSMIIIASSTLGAATLSALPEPIKVVGLGSIRIADDGHGTASMIMLDDEGAPGVLDFEITGNDGFGHGYLEFAAEIHTNDHLAAYPHIIVRLKEFEEVEYFHHSVVFAGWGKLHDQRVWVWVRAQDLDSQDDDGNDYFEIETRDEKGKLIFEAEGELFNGKITYDADS